MDRTTSHLQRNGKQEEVGEVRADRPFVPLVPQRAAERGALQSGCGHAIEANRSKSGDERVRLDDGRVQGNIWEKLFIKLLKNY